MEPTGCCTSPQLGGGGTMPPAGRPPYHAYRPCDPLTLPAAAAISGVCSAVPRA
ncbi:hypothetical protein E2C01_065167 [Portunus trituberculatus]|uniref:Uncharacterized protein n=1 Tax=Portunus trituberculatus TaxID=210409 RepID=A0A5B7HMR0_PORTR|nr:hypothetical protein [Portunus trituberculatus]